jgi:formate dehydrogenase (NADP+) beta subunit
VTEQKFRAAVPDTEYYRKLIKCQAACPVMTDARGYIQALAQGEYELGHQIAHDPNPLSSVCGQICGAPCEAACRRGDIGPENQPVAIRPLKRVLTERYGPEAARTIPGGEQSARFLLAGSQLGRGPGQAGVDFSPVSWSRENLAALREVPGRRTARVAVIGAGPSGLTAAHDLALLGHQVTIFEAGPKSGGMVRLGVPIYRMDWEALDLEVASIEALGVQICYHTRVGVDISLQQIRQEYDAVYLGVGLMQGRQLNIEGVHLDGVIPAVDLLLNYNLGYRMELGKRVVVIGGGDVAMDAARTALRLGMVKAPSNGQNGEAQEAEQSEAVHTALDVARTALRLGVSDVRIMALESWEELPASQQELVEAQEEGIQIFPRLGPVRILGQDGRVTGLEVIEVASVFDEARRFNPRFVPGTERILECDQVILAIGQVADLSVLQGAGDIQVTGRGLVAVNPATGQTSVPGIFCGGDLSQGPRLIIHAVRDGHIAALGMEAYLQERELKTSLTTIWSEVPNHKMPEKWLDYQRTRPPALPVERRTGISQVELGYSEQAAHYQALRCLECSLNTVFDGSLCILCNGCVDVCPWDCLQIVPASELTGDSLLEAVLNAYQGEEQHDGQPHSELAAMIKNDDVCTRCGLCAQRCPTGALTMQSFRFQEKLSYEPGT